MNSIRNMKKATTIMNLVGLGLSVTAFALACLSLLALVLMEKETIDYFENGTLSDLVGGYQILGGLLALGITFVGMAFAIIAIIVTALVVAFFAVPAIHGLSLWKNTGKYLGTDPALYRKHAKRDSVIKLIFNGIPTIVFLVEMIRESNGNFLLAASYFAVVCGLEIAILVKLNKAESRL